MRDYAIEVVIMPAAPVLEGGDGASAPAEPLAPLVVLERAAEAPVAAGRIVRLAALMAAVAAHAGVLYALAREPEDLMAGGRGRQLDAISVTIVSSAVLESRDADRAQPIAPAAAGAVEVNDGAADAPAAEAKREQKSEEVKQAQLQEERKEKTPVEPVRAEEAIIEVAPPAKQPPPKPEAARESAGGAVAQGDAPAHATPSGAAAASPGAVREYGNHVRQALGKTRPKTGVVGGRGTVTVEFVISASGTLVSEKIAKSTGNQRLDDLALAAVRRAAFPVPPPGMTVAQLTYVMPYYFK